MDRLTRSSPPPAVGSSTTPELEPSSPPRVARSAVVAVFDQAAQAHHAVDALRASGLGQSDLALLTSPPPTSSVSSAATDTRSESGALGDMLAAAATDGRDLAD